MSPRLTGVHHLKFPVSDLSASIAWFEATLAATRVEKYDHRHPDGTLFGVILMLPGVPIPVELRVAPAAASATAGFDPVTFGVDGLDGLQRWVDHLDSVGIEHSSIVTGFIGHLVEFGTPDGLRIRIYTDPPNGFADVEMRPDQVDFKHPRLSPAMSPQTASVE
ncbi:VOC family protein [Nocardia niigatensis]|uniref:VOC family protein n=1 Tax=Nocardia niigatensis TaxID=209249 RepID=UPI0002E0329F|nr:VOC family protein [Nocardia niigatensis]